MLQESLLQPVPLHVGGLCSFVTVSMLAHSEMCGFRLNPHCSDLFCYDLINSYSLNTACSLRRQPGCGKSFPDLHCAQSFVFEWRLTQGCVSSLGDSEHNSFFSDGKAARLERVILQ